MLYADTSIQKTKTPNPSKSKLTKDSRDTEVQGLQVPLPALVLLLPMFSSCLSAAVRNSQQQARSVLQETACHCGKFPRLTADGNEEGRATDTCVKPRILY